MLLPIIYEVIFSVSAFGAKWLPKGLSKAKDK